MNPTTAPRRSRAMRTSVIRVLSDLALLRLAILLVAVHVVDDRFLQPQPGTSAADHLVSGLVPLALLGLAAWVFPRVRAGARGAIALTLVLPALLSGSEAIYYANHTGLAGDDFTGLLAKAAAPLLAGVGVHTLGRSRRRTGHAAGRVLRRGLVTIGVVIVAGLAVLPLCVAYIGSHVARADV